MHLKDRRMPLPELTWWPEQYRLQLPALPLGQQQQANGKTLPEML
jgi:hypothetical protein